MFTKRGIFKKMDEQEYIQGLKIIKHNLIVGRNMFDRRPLAWESCKMLADFIDDMLSGITMDEILKKYEE